MIFIGRYGSIGLYLPFFCLTERKRYDIIKIHPSSLNGKSLANLQCNKKRRGFAPSFFISSKVGFPLNFNLASFYPMF